jgi:signal transduction histidine kinase
MATPHQRFATRPGSGPLLDVAMAAVVLAVSLLQISHGAVPGWVADGAGRGDAHREALSGLADLDWYAGMLAVCASAPLVAWRRSAVGVFAVIGAASALLAGLGYPLWAPLGAGVALFLLAASRDERSSWTPQTTSIVLLVFCAYVGAAGLDKGGFPGAELLHGGLAFAVAWFAGERTRLRREHVAELKERAARAERDADRERRLAVAEERARIARDLHDAAGHAISVITVQAGAARTRRDPERSQEALELIEELARQTAADIDGIVGRLRDRGTSNGTPEAPVGLASLDMLIARHAASGLDVRVDKRGVVQPLEGATDQAAYRILQEALTNAGRHGTGAARVELAFGEAALELTVTNRAPRGPRLDGGHGLIGMRERVRLLGGNFEARNANGDFQIRAHLPYRGPYA